MSGFKQHLELAQSFQNEMADVDGVSVTVSVYEGVSDGKFVVVTATDNKPGKSDLFVHLIGGKITAEALAEIKEKLKGFGYEV